MRISSLRGIQKKGPYVSRMVREDFTEKVGIEVDLKVG